MSQDTKRPTSEILEMAQLIARVEEARTVGGLPQLKLDPDLSKEELLEELCTQLADDLENNSRRLIQTSVQLLGLREVAASAVALPNPEQISGHIATYLRKAFGFQQVLLLGADNDEGALRGVWTPAVNGLTDEVPLRIPFDRHDSVILSVFYSDTPSLVENPEAFPLFGGISAPTPTSPDLVGSYTLVPLVGGRVGAGPWSAPDVDAVRSTSDGTRAVGVLGVVEPPKGKRLGPDDLRHLESIAPGVASALETALLTMDLRRNERFTASVLDSMSSGLVAVDLDGRIMIFNRMAEKLTGWGADEALGMSFETVLPESGGDSHVLATLREGTQFTRVETTFRLRGGGDLPVSLATFLIMDEESNPIGAVGSFVDLTPLRRMEAKVRQLDRLATLGRFTSAVAHEIRNPLAGIAAGAQYIGKSLTPEDPQQENLKFVLDEIGRLNRIISDLFNITHPQQPLLQPQRLEPVLQRSIKTVEELAKVAGATIEVETLEGTPVVEIDPDQMEQVLINLLKNGIEASGQGGVVQVKMTIGRGRLGAADGPEENYLEVTVRDSGPGISEEDELRIFEPFYSTKDGGTGLGLYVSKGIVERHGGIISVHSGDEGCAFAIRLPLKASSEEDSRR